MALLKDLERDLEELTCKQKWKIIELGFTDYS